MSESVASLETVWAVCPYLRGTECMNCPRTETIHGHEDCVRACFALAEEAVNIAQTGNAWRKPSPTAGVKLPPQPDEAREGSQSPDDGRDPGIGQNPFNSNTEHRV